MELMHILLQPISNAASLHSLLGGLANKKLLGLRRSLEKSAIEPAVSPVEARTVPLRKVRLSTDRGSIKFTADLSPGECEGVVDLLAGGLKGDAAAALDATLFKSLKRDATTSPGKSLPPGSVSFTLPAEVSSTSIKDLASSLVGAEKKSLRDLKIMIADLLSGQPVAATDGALIKASLTRKGEQIGLDFPGPSAVAIVREAARQMSQQNLAKLDSAIAGLMVNV